MANEKIEISDNMLELVSAGSVSYTPDYPKAKSGKIGIDGNEIYHYSCEKDVYDYILAHYQDKNWSSFAEQDNYLIKGLLDAGLIK